MEIALYRRAYACASWHCHHRGRSDVRLAGGDVFDAQPQAATAAPATWRLTSPMTIRGSSSLSSPPTEVAGRDICTPSQDRTRASPKHRTRAHRNERMPRALGRSWLTLTSPDVRRLTNAVTVGHFAYLVGGWNASSALGTTLRAEIDSTGALVGGGSPWTQMAAFLGQRRYAHAVASATLGQRRFLYVVGGAYESIPSGTSLRSIEKAEINVADGSLGDWGPAGADLPEPFGLSSRSGVRRWGIPLRLRRTVWEWSIDKCRAARRPRPGGRYAGAVRNAGRCLADSARIQSTVVSDNTLYVIGGYTSNAVDVAPLALDGSPQWTVGPPLGVARQTPGAAILGGRVYAVGGRRRPLTGMTWKCLEQAETAVLVAGCQILTVTACRTRVTTAQPPRTPIS